MFRGISEAASCEEANLMFVRDCMSSPAVTITFNTLFQDVLKTMHRNRVRLLPVVNKKGELIGVISERDLLYVSPSPDTSMRVWELIYLISKLQERGIIDNELITRTPELFVWELAHLLSTIDLQEIMTSDVIAITPDNPIEDAAHLMLENKIRGLPVVDEDNCVVGVITESDIVKAFVGTFVLGNSDSRATLDVPVEESIYAIDGETVKPKRKGKAMTKRILVPLDGSALAERALPCAAMLAQGLSAKLVLFRAVSPVSDLEGALDVDNANTSAGQSQLEAEANSYLGQVAARLQEAGLKVDHVVWQGPASDLIVDFAEQMGVNQIVMATHGYSGVSRRRYGSVAERVLQSTKTPVLLVCAQRSEERGVHKPKVCRRILVPLDGSHLAEQALAPTIPIAQALDAEIVLFRVSVVSASGRFAGDWNLPLEGSFATADQIAQAYLNRVADRLRGQGIRVSAAIRRGAVVDSIVDFVQANHIDLIAMCTRGRVGEGRWALGSVADGVLRARCTPLLLVRAQRARGVVSSADEHGELHNGLSGVGVVNTEPDTGAVPAK
jgi:CBS domain-containing protein/nucleotide-binding universal stress UspA family protein